MRDLLGLLRILFVIFLSGCGGSDVRTLLHSSESLIRVPRSSALLKGYSIYPGHNVAYKITDEQLSWAEARNRCIVDGGNLAIADTSDKIQFIRNGLSVAGNWLYVGIWRPAASQKWIRVDNGLPATLLPWIYSYIPSADTGYNCAAIARTSSELMDISCEWKEKSVCEISLNSDPVTTRSEQTPGEVATDATTKMTTPTTIHKNGTDARTRTRVTTVVRGEIPVYQSSASFHTLDGWGNTIIFMISLILYTDWLM